ncbi:excalibur calcium-binding domain-containing protein [Geodermatophilus obscurus]|nr:excalibur calcium-binding domain-containing protein [Geodermatophilus obscurus]
MQLPAQPPGDGRARKPRRWLRWAVPLLAFLLGIGVGGAGGQADPTTTPQYQSLRAELDTAQTEAGALGDEVAAAEEQVRAAAAAAQARIEEQTAAISQRATALDQREQGLIARESALRAAEQAATSRTSSGGSSSSSSGSASSGTGSAPLVEREPQVSSSVSYANCSAARAAGAAPVRSGDPGYGRHLDRDGDGVGCE